MLLLTRIFLIVASWVILYLLGREHGAKAHTKVQKKLAPSKKVPETRGAPKLRNPPQPNMSRQWKHKT